MAGDVDRPPAAAALRPVQPMLCPVVIGRDRELASLLARTDSIVDGGGGVVALVGDAGAGKTRLCREVVAHARGARVVVLSGRAVPSETPVPYRPLTEALLGAVRSARPPDAPELVGFGGQLGRLVPQWRTDGTDGADESPVLLGEAVVRLLDVLGGHGGALLVLDDLHWADAETIEVVEYLGNALLDQRTLVLCTSRPIGAASSTVARLQRADPRSVIGVERLSDEEVEHVVVGCLGGPTAPAGVVPFIQTHSDGIPFLVEELLAGLVASGALARDGEQWIATRELRATVPFSFADSLRPRLAALDATARRVISAAAVLGRRFDWDLLPGVADVDGRAVIDALRLGVDEQLVDVEGEGFKFRHALTREAVLAELLPPERRDLSQRAWPAIERAHPGLPGAWCELAAELAEASGEPVEAARRLIESASRAVATGAFVTAEATARRARQLAEGERDVVDAAEEALVRTLAFAGKVDEALALGAGLVERLRGAAGAREVELLVVLARAAVAAGDAGAATGFSDRARELVATDMLDDATSARVVAVAAHVALAGVRIDDAERLAKEAIGLAVATAQPAVHCEALEVLGRVYRLSDWPMGMRQFAEEARIAAAHGLVSWQLRAQQELALADWVDGRQAPLGAVRDLAARHGALVTVAHMNLALADFGLSSWYREQCLDAAARCVEGSRRLGLASLPVAELWMAGAHALAGNREQMEAAAARALEPDPDDPRILGDLWGRVRATYAAVVDDRALLRESLDRQMDYARVAPVTTSVFPNRILWAFLHTIEDDDFGAAARAEVAAAENLRIWPQLEAIQETMEAIADGRQGRGDRAAQRIEAPLRLLRDNRLAQGTVELHVVLAAEAAIRDGWGDPARWLRGAEAFFADGGYPGLVRVCRALMAKTGAPVPRRGRGESTVPAPLRALGITSRELDVLTLIADGLTYREIADRLYLSPKTVERHVSNLFDRTGVRNRNDLAAFARANGASANP